MTTNEMGELVELLDRVHALESLFSLLETYYLVQSDEWSPRFRAYFRESLDRKLDQIDHEWEQIHKMGMAIATGRALRRIDHDL